MSRREQDEVYTREQNVCMQNPHHPAYQGHIMNLSRGLKLNHIRTLLMSECGHTNDVIIQVIVDEPTKLEKISLS